MVASGVTDHAIANQMIPRKQEAAADWGEQHLFGLWEKPLDGDVTEHRRHGPLQGLDHLREQRQKRLRQRLFQVQTGRVQ